jgi:hypothetical protein
MQLRNLLITTYVALANIVSAQSYTLGVGGNVITTCSGNILDPGGVGDYGNNLNITQTFCSGSNDCIQLTINNFATEANFDYLRVYDGITSTSEPLFEFSGIGNLPATVITGTNASGGCLTLVFNSDDSQNNSGFDISVQCAQCTVAPNVYILGEGSTTINTCDGIVRDPGGLSNYLDNLNVIQTFCSNTGQCVRFTFEELQLENSVDIIKFYDGTSISAPLIDELSGFSIPPPITCSIASGGCITIQLISNDSISYSGLKASISCVPCVVPTQTIILGESDSTIQTCNGILKDSGGLGNYGDNENITQTICSGDGQCLKLTFIELNTEPVFDRLTIYDGPTINSEVISIVSGFNLPIPITSSTSSSGCLTLVFTSNNSISYNGFKATISCVTCQNSPQLPTGLCNDAQPFCTDNQEGITFPAAINTQSEFGNGICCLGGTPNPAWYYLKIEDPGNLDVLITSGFDVDFACWGPFDESEWQNGVCEQVIDPFLSCLPSILVDCSFSGAAIENCNIPDAQQGDYYLMLITNFSNQITNINFTKTGGAATTNCDIVFCTSNIDIDVSFCDSTSNTYSLNGYLITNNSNFDETVVLTNSSGGVIQFNAPFQDTLYFSFNNLASNGELESITAVFSSNSYCNVERTYFAPEACSPCGVSATTSSPICEGENLILLATAPTLGQFSWIGPNDFYSTNQSIVFPQSDSIFSGLYTVTYFNPIDSCRSVASVNVLVQPKPAPPILSNNSPVCRDSVLKLFANFEPYAVYNWNSENAFESAVQNPIINFPDVAYSGEYSCYVTINGCASDPSITQAEILPAPNVQDIFYSYFDNTLNSSTQGELFKWYLNGELIQNDTFPKLIVNSNGTYQLEIIYENGCSRRSQLFDFNSLGINPLVSSNLISIYPNPSNGEFAIQTDENGIVEMYDVAGKLIYKSKVQKGKNDVNIGNCASGFYILKLESKSGNQFSRIYLKGPL